MCIFNGRVQKVSGTRIFVGTTADGRQFTAYSNNVEIPKQKATAAATGGPTQAMILPFPVPLAKQAEYDESKSHLVEYNKDIIQLVNLSKYTKFFDDCNSLFRQKSKSRSRELLKSAPGSLEVVQLGGYSVSVARTLEDLKRIDKEKFVVNPRIYELLGKHYGKGFGFVICSFSSNIHSEHPIAYAHHLQQDENGTSTEKLFVPCKHDHGDADEDVEFDHEIFSMNSKPSVESKEKKTTVSPLMLPMITVKLADQKNFCKSVITGNFKNDDLYFGLYKEEEEAAPQGQKQKAAKEEKKKAAVEVVRKSTGSKRKEAGSDDDDDEDDEDYKEEAIQSGSEEDEEDKKPKQQTKKKVDPAPNPKRTRRQHQQSFKTGL